MLLNIFLFGELYHLNHFFLNKILEYEKRTRDNEKEIQKLKDELNKSELNRKKQDVRIEALQNDIDKMKLEKSNYSGRILFLILITNTKHLLNLRNSLLKFLKDQTQNQTKKIFIVNSKSCLF